MLASQLTRRLTRTPTEEVPLPTSTPRRPSSRCPLEPLLGASPKPRRHGRAGDRVQPNQVSRTARHSSPNSHLVGLSLVRRTHHRASNPVCRPKGRQVGSIPIRSRSSTSRLVGCVGAERFGRSRGRAGLRCLVRSSTPPVATPHPPETRPGTRHGERQARGGSLGGVLRRVVRTDRFLRVADRTVEADAKQASCP